MIPIQINYSPYRQDIFITGMKGSGKTTKCKTILVSINHLRKIIWSPQKPTEHYDGFGRVVYDFKEMNDTFTGGLLYNGDFSVDNFVKFLEHTFHNCHNVVLVLDDLHEYVHKHSVLQALSNVIQSGRNRGISNIMLATTPASIPNWILGNVTHAFAFEFHLEGQIEWCQKNFFGLEAWLLTSKDKRIKFFNGENDPEILPKYSYIYRNVEEPKTRVVINEST